MYQRNRQGKTEFKLNKNNTNSSHINHIYKNKAKILDKNKSLKKYTKQ